MIVDLPPPPAPVTARIEASFALPAAPPYAHLFAREGETLPEGVPVRQLYRSAGRRVGGGQLRLASANYALANPIKPLLDHLGFSFRTLCLEIRKKMILVPVTESSNDGESGGLGDGPPPPLPPGDPIPVDGGGGKPNGG